LFGGLVKAKIEHGATTSGTWRIFLEKSMSTSEGEIIVSQLAPRDQVTNLDPQQKKIQHTIGWGSDSRRHGLPKGGNAPPVILSPLGGLSYSPFEHRGWFSKMRKRWHDRPARRATLIAAYNESEARHLRDINAHPRIEVLPLGIDTQEYAPVVTLRQSLKPKQTGHTILYLGPIHPREGLVPFLKAFAELGPDADGWNVVLAGRSEPQWRGKIEAAIQRKGGADRVTIQDAPDLPAQLSLLAQADILVCPALQHRCPTSIMQALASGVPVVATEPVAPDGVGDAMVVCRPSRDEWRESLRTVLTMSDDQRRALGKRGLAWIRAQADWSVLVDRYVALYQSLV